MFFSSTCPDFVRGNPSLPKSLNIAQVNGFSASLAQWLFREGWPYALSCKLECFPEWKGALLDYTGVISRCGLFPDRPGCVVARVQRVHLNQASLSRMSIREGWRRSCALSAEATKREDRSLPNIVWGLWAGNRQCHHAAPWRWRKAEAGESQGNRAPALVTQVLGVLHTLPQENTFIAIPSPPYRGLPWRQATPCPLSWALRRYFDFPIEYFLWKVLPWPWKISQS